MGRNVIQFKDKDNNVYDVKDVVARTTKADVIINNTESAPVTSVKDAMGDMPVKTLEVQIEPVQDLHGYDNPWPAGGGKNLYNKDGTDTANGYVDGKILKSDGSENTPGSPVQWEISEYIEVSPSTSYVISGQTNLSSSGIVYLCEYDSSKNFIKSTDDSFASVTFTTDQNTKYVRLTCKKESNATRQLEQGSTATPYAPYSNLCPISGWTEADVTRTGKNLMSLSDVKKGRYDDNTFVLSSTTSNVLRSYEANLPAGTYTISFDKLVRIICTIVDGVYTAVGSNGTSRTITTSDGKIGISWRDATSSSTAWDDTSPIQIEIGSSASSYEAFAGNTYTYTFPQSAGTVYGAKLTIHQDGSGELVVDRAETDLGNLSYSMISVTHGNLFRAFVSGIKQVADSLNLVCSAYKTTTPANRANCTISKTTGGNVDIIDNAYESASAFKTGATGVKLVYELATPVTYQLTNQQVVELLKGTNNIWSNTGNTAIEYAADTKLYIDGKIAELQALILES